MKKWLLLGALLSPCAVLAQGATVGSGLGYTYAELRYVDADNDGDGLRANGSFDLGNNWLIVGGLTSLNYDNDVDFTMLEIGGGYVYPFRESFDLTATLRFVDAEVDTPVGDADDTGLALSGGVRGLVAPQFEVRGSVNYINLDDSDTYLELAADYHFTQQISAGVSLEFAGDNDLFTLGGRWYFR